MRTVKASEVAKGMRVQFDVDREGVTYTITSSVTGNPFIGSARTDMPLGTGGRVIETLPNDHPVTVLAEPEPEWVEGAWYRCRIGENEPENLRRLPHGWTPFHDTDRVFHADGDNEADMLTVLGRVLIVDWPGDDVARYIERNYRDDYEYIDEGNLVAQKVANAIRTQGGAR